VKPSPADIEVRWQNAIELAELHGLRCTGGMDRVDCTSPGAIGVAAYGQIVALNCRAHLDGILKALARAGYGAGLRCVALVDLLEVPGFKAGIESIRRANIEKGSITFTLDPSFARRSHHAYDADHARTEGAVASIERRRRPRH
jgi:hypothetical protein